MLLASAANRGSNAIFSLGNGVSQTPKSLPHTKGVDANLHHCREDWPALIIRMHFAWNLSTKPLLGRPENLFLIFGGRDLTDQKGLCYNLIHRAGTDALGFMVSMVSINARNW